MSFVLNNTQIAVSQARLDYNKVRLEFVSLAKAAAKKFSSTYATRFKNLDDVHNHCDEAAYSHIRSAVEVALQHLVKRGIYDIDSDAFLDFLDPYFTWPGDFAEINDAYEEIVADAEALDEYRVNRRESRGQVVGFGFGLEGAVKGAITAGAANMTLGAAHRAANGLGKIVSSVIDIGKKNAIFSEPQTKQRLVNGIQRAVFNVHFAFIDAVNDKQPGSFTDLVTEEAHTKAARLLQNVALGRLPKDVVPTVLTEAIHLDPYNEKLYNLWFEQLGDQNGQLEIAENFFGIDIVGRTKRDLIKVRKSALNLSTPEACKASLVQLSDYAKTIGYQHFAEEQASILALADRLDRERRTVEGKEYPTLAQADDAREALRLEIIRRDNTLSSSGLDILKAAAGGFFLLLSLGAIIGKAPFLALAICLAIAVVSFASIRSIRIMKLTNGLGCSVAAVGVLILACEIVADSITKEPVNLSGFGGSALCVAVGWGIGKLMRLRYQEAGHGDFKQYFAHSLAGGAILGAVLAAVITSFSHGSKPETVPASPAAVPAATPSPAPLPVVDQSGKNNLPFVGRRTFNFYGGNGTGEALTITADGHARLEGIGTTGTNVEFEGRFSNPLPLGDGEELIFKGQAVYETKGGKVKKGCKSERLDCADILSDEAPTPEQQNAPLTLRAALADEKAIVCRLNDMQDTCTDTQQPDTKPYLREDYVISKGYTAILSEEMFTEPGTSDNYVKFTVKP